MAKLRIRQHVNPLNRKYLTPLNPPDWSQIYALPQQPLHLDLGCAQGLFLLEMAQLKLNFNFLGIEIRAPLVKEINKEKERLSLTNLHYLSGNINSSIGTLLKSLPVGVLQYITIQFPDPWFKNKHAKRRLVTKELVNTLAYYLSDGGKIFIQSDVELLALKMRDRFLSHPHLQLQHEDLWIADNPLPVATEREKYVLARNKPVYRALFVKKIPRSRF